MWCINAHSGTLLFEALGGGLVNGLAVELMDETTVQDFWQNHSCGDALVGGLRDRFGGDYEKFFSDYDKFRYDMESHIPACLDALGVSGKRVLEIGLGEGADSESLIRRGARWSGVDLTGESVERVRTRLTLRELPFDDLKQGSVLDLPFEDNSFDMVFSHGVLLVVPEIGQAEKEIHRVLRPGGELVIMMYARWSLNYLVAIGLVRRAALLAAFPLAKAGLLRLTRRGNARRPPRQRQQDRLGRYLRLRSSSTTTPTARPTRIPRCGTRSASSGTSRPSGSPAPTSASCTPRHYPCTACPAGASWAGTYGRTCPRQARPPPRPSRLQASSRPREGHRRRAR